MHAKISSLLVALLFIVSSGCDDGPVGPPGPPGRDGNANVFSLNFEFVPAEATLNGAVASAQYDVPAITPGVVDDGAVLVYFRDQGTWTALPFTVGVEALDDPPRVDYTFTFGYGYDDGFLEVFLEASTVDEVVLDEIVLDLLPEFYEMKAVIINGFPLGKNSDVDLRDYEAVKAYFGLDE